MFIDWNVYYMQYQINVETGLQSYNLVQYFFFIADDFCLKKNNVPDFVVSVALCCSVSQIREDIFFH